MRELGQALLFSVHAGSGEPAFHVVVVSDQRLLRDSVRSALRSAGFTTTSAGIPTGTYQVHAARRWIASLGPAIGLLVADIDNAPHLRSAVAAVHVFDVEWLLLTSTPLGAAWGALIEAGVRDVFGATTNLADLGNALRRVAAGRSPTSGRSHQQALLAWRNAPETNRQLLRRVEALSPREMEVLIDLHHGDSPRMIAERVGVSEGTVRSQVKSLLRKLEVTSQLQAVASYRQLNAWIAS